MISKAKLDKLQLGYSGLRYKNLIDEAEVIAKTRPEWMVKKIKRLDDRVRRLAVAGKDAMFTLGWFSFGVRTKNRLAMGIVLCDKGYYVSMGDPAIYVSWNWSHSGLLKFKQRIERRQGEGWNIDKIKLSEVYNVLMQEKDNA